MDQFGWNLAPLFMDSPWIFDPGYTQIRQVNQSTFRVNTLKLWPKLKPNQTSQHLESTRGSLFFVINGDLQIYFKKISPFYKKNAYGPFIKKMKPLISAFIKNSIFLKSTDPWCQHFESIPWATCLRKLKQEKRKMMLGCPLWLVCGHTCFEVKKRSRLDQLGPILLLLIPLSLNLLYFPLCSTGGLLVTRLSSG